MAIKWRKTARSAARVKRRLRPAAPKVARARSSDAGEVTSKPMLIGYARVSTVDQNLALQRDALTEAGCGRIFTEQLSGAVTDRPALHDALEFARSGDTMIVWKLDRLAGSMKQLIETIEELRQRENLLQSGRDQFPVFPGDEIKAVAQQVNDAGLYRRLREHRGDRLREALEAVDDGDQHVFDAAVLDLVHDAQPEFGALVLFQPKPQDFLAAVGAHAKRDVDGLVSDQPFIADLDPQRVKEDQRIDRFQRARLPGGDLIEHRVGDGADQIGRDVDAVEIAQMADNLAGAHAAGVHRDDLVVEPREAALIFGDQLRIETGLAIARHRQLDPAGVGDDRLLAIAISPVARLFAGEMMIHLGVENPFRQRLLQIVDEPIGLQGGLRVDAGQQLIKHGVGNTRFFATWHGRAPLLRSCPTPHEIPDSPPPGGRQGP